MFFFRSRREAKALPYPTASLDARLLETAAALLEQAADELAAAKAQHLKPSTSPGAATTVAPVPAASMPSARMALSVSFMVTESKSPCPPAESQGRTTAKPASRSKRHLVARAERAAQNISGVFAQRGEIE
jgi:hypothetical protein